jgi:geranylgeranyl transferase type-1 subunit beta
MNDENYMNNSNEVNIDSDSSQSSDSVYFKFNPTELIFEKAKHINYFKFIFKSLKNNPSLETHKITLLHFIIAGLKILNSLTEEEIELGLRFVINNAVIYNNKIKGFRGGTFSGWSYNNNYKNNMKCNSQDKPHIAATYCALSIFKMCNYSLDSVNGLDKISLKFQEVLQNDKIIFDDEHIIKEIQLSQNECGQISAQSFDTENDVRFFYCAMSIFKLLGKDNNEIKNLINYEASHKFLNSIQSYEGGFSMVDEGESNAGTTFTAIASYKILGLDIPNKNKLINWLCSRNSSLGVNGRTNKIPDSCYSFWVMGSLSNLGFLELFDREHTINFLLNCQTLKVIYI